MLKRLHQLLQTSQRPCLLACMPVQGMGKSQVAQAVAAEVGMRCICVPGGALLGPAGKHADNADKLMRAAFKVGPHAGTAAGVARSSRFLS